MIDARVPWYGQSIPQPSFRQAEQLLRTASSPILRHPWTALTVPPEGLPLVAYGSLMDPAAAQPTLPRTVVEAGEPVLAFGLRRCFSYRLSTSRYGPFTGDFSPAALNLHHGDGMNDGFNGVLIHVPPDAIDALRQREALYDLVPVSILAWWALDQPPRLAYALSCPFSDETLQPQPGYYRLCRDGAARFGDAFLHTYLATTYLADAQTSLLDWEASPKFPGLIDRPEGFA